MVYNYELEKIKFLAYFSDSCINEFCSKLIDHKNILAYLA